MDIKLCSKIAKMRMRISHTPSFVVVATSVGGTGWDLGLFLYVFLPPFFLHPPSFLVLDWK